MYEDTSETKMKLKRYERISHLKTHKQPIVQIKPQYNALFNLLFSFKVLKICESILEDLFFLYFSFHHTRHNCHNLWLTKIVNTYTTCTVIVLVTCFIRSLKAVSTCLLNTNYTSTHTVTRTSRT